MPMMKKIKKKLTKAEKEERKKVKVYRKKINTFIDTLEDSGMKSDEYIDNMHVLLSKALKDKRYDTIKGFILLEAVLTPVIKDGETVYVGVS